MLKQWLREKTPNQPYKATVEQRVKQHRDCSHVGDRDEDDVMNWDEDAELKKQREEVKKVEEKLKQKEVGGGGQGQRRR